MLFHRSLICLHRIIPCSVVASAVHELYLFGSNPTTSIISAPPFFCPAFIHPLHLATASVREDVCVCVCVYEDEWALEMEGFSILVYIWV